MFKHLFTRNLGWKVSSIGLAALVWFTASYGLERSGLTPGTRRTFTNLPVTVMTDANRQRDYIIEPAVVRATFRGDQALLEGLQPSEITVFVNLTGIADAKSFRRRVDVHAPAGVTLAWVVPSEVNVRDGSASAERAPAANNLP
jgi:hypothetical protein